MAFVVWAKFGTYRYQRTQAAGSGTAVTWKQARNERRSFQILARSTSPVDNVDITPATLTDGRGNNIDVSNIGVYRAQQIEITTPSFQTAESIADGETLEGLGWYPDALIPTKHPVTGNALAAGATYQALPFALAADQTHTFLVDIFVPVSTVAGTYTGTVTVSADGEADVEIAVTLTVWNITLPDTPALQTALWAGTVDRMYVRRSGWLNWSLTTEQWEGDVTANVNTVLAVGGIAAQPFHVAQTLDFKPEPNDELGSYVVTAEQISQLQTHIDTYHPSAIMLQDSRRLGGPFTG